MVERRAAWQHYLAAGAPSADPHEGPQPQDQWWPPWAPAGGQPPAAGTLRLSVPRVTEMLKPLLCKA